MNRLSDHIHIDDLVADSDSHFIIDTTTRKISNVGNNKVILMQYDEKSERYSFDIDRYIEGHDLLDCNRVRVHFINVGSKNQKSPPGLYPVEDVHVKPDDDTKISFTWIISNGATMHSGSLQFLVSFECVEGEDVLYRWSTDIYSDIKISAGMNNDDATLEVYSDELLAWQHDMETNVLPLMVDERYIERDFATSGEVAAIFALEEGETGYVTLTPYEPVTDAEIDALFENQNGTI